MDKFEVTFTRDELEMIWCLAFDNMKYWKDSVFIYGNKKDMFMYNIARASYAKLQKLLPNGITQHIKGVTKNKYRLIIKRR